MADSGRAPEPPQAPPAVPPSPEPAAPPSVPPASGPSFGWRGGVAVGAAVLVIVYAIAAVTAWLAPLRDFVEHEPVTIAVLVVGTVAVLALVIRSAIRR